MTKQKMNTIVAIALLSVLVGVGAGMVAPKQSFTVIPQAQAATSYSTWYEAAAAIVNTAGAIQNKKTADVSYTESPTSVNLWRTAINAVDADPRDDTTIINAAIAYYDNAVSEGVDVLGVNRSTNYNTVETLFDVYDLLIEMESVVTGSIDNELKSEYASALSTMDSSILTPLVNGNGANVGAINYSNFITTGKTVINKAYERDLLTGNLKTRAEALGAGTNLLTNTLMKNNGLTAMANEGDSVTNGTTATTTSVSVTEAISGNEVVHTGLTVGFPIETTTEGGSVRVLIPTATASATAAGGVPAEKAFILPTDYFDADGKITATASDMFSCPGAGSGATFTASSVSVVLYHSATDTYETVTGLKDDGAGAVEGKDIRYLAYTCTFTGIPTRGGAANVTASDTDDDYKIVINDLINPKASWVRPGQQSTQVNEAITTPGRVQLFDSTGNTMLSDIDVLISTIQQDVLVKAKIEYQLMFRVDGVAAGDTTVACGNRPTVTSGPLRIDYGSASIGIPVDAAQRIYVNSSVPNGYKVTMSQNRNMRRQDTLNDINDSTYATLCYTDDGMVDSNTINRDCIPNFGWNYARTGGTSALLATQSDSWTNDEAASTSNPKTGFGYTVGKNSASAAETDIQNTGRTNGMFATKGSSETDTGSKNAGTYYSRIATRNLDGTAGTSLRGLTTTMDPTVIAFSDHVSTGEYYDVCYRLVVDGQNNAGVYDNEVTYTITASI